MKVYVIIYRYFDNEIIYGVVDSEEKAREYCEKENASFSTYELENFKGFYYEEYILNEFRR